MKGRGLAALGGLAFFGLNLFGTVPYVGPEINTLLDCFFVAGMLAIVAGYFFGGAKCGH